MSPKQKFADTASRAVWTSPQAYVEALARKRSFRRAHREKLRTEPERPRLLLSTLPFLALMALLAVLVIAIAITAFPGNQPPPKKQVARHEQGVAERGWFQEAQTDMHR